LLLQVCRICATSCGFQDYLNYIGSNATLSNYAAILEVLAVICFLPLPFGALRFIEQSRLRILAHRDGADDSWNRHNTRKCLELILLGSRGNGLERRKSPNVYSFNPLQAAAGTGSVYVASGLGFSSSSAWGFGAP
jgi:hypothetical protein